MVVTNARVGSPRSPTNKKINKKSHKMKLKKPNHSPSSLKLKELTQDDVVASPGLASKINCTVQELKFAKIFAGNNTIHSASQLGKLKKWLKIRSNSSMPFEDQDLLRIWKGLFYCMWMSDKPLPQEKLADDIALLVHCFDQPMVGIQFFGTFLKIMSIEWFGIDQWRIDKFMMLVRRVLRQMFVALHNQNWNDELLINLNGKIEANALNSSVNTGFCMHFIEIYFEEVAKVTQGDISVEAVTLLCKPFAEFIAKPRNLRLAKHTVKYTFKHLLFQSELGLEYKEKFDAWKNLGFPGKSIDDMELVEPEEDAEAAVESGDEDDDDEDVAHDSDEEQAEEEEEGENEDNGALDPRAGRVDVVMPQIQFDPLSIVKILEEANSKKYTNVKTRRVIDHVIQSYSTFSTGRFPLGIQKIKLKSDKIELPPITDKVNEWLEFEKKLYGKDRQMKTLNKKKRKKMIQSNDSIAPSPPKKMRQNSIDTTDNTPQALIKKRKLPLTPLERKKINQWKEDDIIIPSLTPQTVVTKHQNGDIDNSIVSNDFVKSSTPKSSSSIKKKKLKLENFELNKTTTDEVLLLKEQREEEVTPIKLITNKKSKDPMMMTPQLQTILSSNIVINPAAIRGKLNSLKKDKLNATPQTPQQHNSLEINQSITTTQSGGEKKVKIMLKFNRSQDTSEYMKQLRSSPNVPYDSAKKPTKGLLKPNLMPSPINPFYKKKLGLNF